MLVRSHSERRPLPGFSALLTHSTSKPKDETSDPPPLSFSSREPIFSPLSLTSPPPWVTQALSNLEQGEQELLSLRERQQAEVEEVNRQLDNAVFEAQREERRLLEKVEQDHRDAQRRLDQVKRENAAAVRVVQSLVDQQIRKIGQLKDQIQRWGSTAGGANKSQLQRGVAEVTQPWEISLTLKRVSFLPTSWSANLSLGEVDVQEQGMTYPIGVCGVQGQKCALHSGDPAFTNITPLEIRQERPSTKTGQKGGPEEGKKTNDNNMRVVRKLRLSSSENEDELRLSNSKSPIPGNHDVSESSQDEEESVCSDTHGQDLFLAIPPVFSQGESEGDESDGRQNGHKKRSALKSKRKQKSLVLVSCEEPSCPPEETSGRGVNGPISPFVKRKGSFSKRSLVDLSRRPLSQQSRRKASMDSGSPPSPAESEDSCHTYSMNTPANGSLKQEHNRSMSTADLSGKLHPLINSDKADYGGIRKVNRMRLASNSSSLEQGQGNGAQNVNKMNSDERQSKSKTITRGSGLNRVSRSLSMSAIEGEKLTHVKEAQKNHEKPVPALKELEEECVSTALDSACLVKQFGKQGSGRNDFNLPSGVHAAVKGQLFVVDCGNARIQVTDIQKNIVQQVSPSGTDRSSRICNYFDVAVNSKGLIALTCAAERAVLVFSRHGRLLQTFGGTMIGSTNEELDAPRGITVTRQDDFLVADIKRGTLTALKLDPKTGARVERTVVSGYHRPYLVAACLTTGLMAVSERGNETGRVPCIRVLEPGWTTIRILGVCSGMGPVLTCPWGLCIDSDGDVLVADWGKQHHRVLIYPSKGVGWVLVNDNLSSPRGLALLPDGHMVVADSMNHCVKIYQYKSTEEEC